MVQYKVENEGDCKKAGLVQRSLLKKYVTKRLNYKNAPYKTGQGEK